MSRNMCYPCPRSKDSRGGDCPTWLSRIPVQAPDEIEPPFLNGSNDILGTEALNHLGHGEPVPEPLALRIPHDRRSLEERGHDVRPRQNEKYVSPNTRTPTAWAACRQVDDDETAKELSDAASFRCVSYRNTSRYEERVKQRLKELIKAGWFLPLYSKQVESDAKNVLITRFPPGGIIL